jgi:hypothetical protein
MGLYARITATDGTKISVHRFGAALREYAAGGVTRAQVIATFGLTGSDVTELDALAATYTAMPSGSTAQVLAKAAYLDRMEDVFLLCETGDYTESVAKSRLGF